MRLHIFPRFLGSGVQAGGEALVLPALEGAEPGDIVWAFEEPDRESNLQPEAAQSVPALPSPESIATGTARPQAVRIDAEKVDGVLNLVGELVVIKSQIMQDETVSELKDQRLNGLLLLLDKTVRELQEASLSMRMTSLRTSFLRLQRVVSELSGRLGKLVDLEVTGEDTEMDRSIVELLGDPLLHLCRNALDHGIESPQERQACGKPLRGRLRVAAGRQGGRIHIDISDDGRGIDRNEVVRVARERGLLAPGGDAAALSPREVFDLLFVPGFTTSPQVNDVSGRGVGLDVVRTNLDAVKGTVEVSSELGKGTLFRLWIPLTTAITDAMLLQVAENTFVLPIEVIRELVQPEVGMISEGEDGEEVVNVRGSLLPLVRLSEILAGRQVTRHAAQSPRSVIIVVEERQARVALMVDAVLGQSQVVVKGLGPALPSSRGVGGAAILGDGRVGLIIDVLDLIQEYSVE